MIANFFNIENECELEAAVHKCQEINNLNKYSLLHVISDSEKIPLALKKQTDHVGYDVGVCEDEKTIYSSIFNEILFGHYNELIVYKDYPQ